ncbi:hypothetical protein [Mobiluncus porci]|nr:hypothetical protein [Mobiluncus porci]
MSAELAVPELAVAPAIEPAVAAVSAMEIPAPARPVPPGLAA